MTGTFPHSYILPVSAGQILSVDVDAPGPTTLWVSGENGTILAGNTMDEAIHWEGRVPSTQAYLLELVGPGAVSGFDEEAVMHRLEQVLYSMTVFPPEEEMLGNDD